MIKYIESPTLEGSDSSIKEIDFSLDKIASDVKYQNYPKDLVDTIMSITPKEGHAYLLDSAVSCQDWGNNSNADYFPTEGLEHEGDDFGFKTFEQANWFRQHQNKDPLKSRGKPIKSSWDSIMGRILLIIDVDLNKDPETREMLAKHLPIKTSMGARVKYDICNVCHPNWKEFYKIPEPEMIRISKSNSLDEVHNIGKKYGVDLSYIKEMKPNGGPKGIHRKVSEYCEHMRLYRNRITPSGIRAGVINLRPKFFDISNVGVNADKSSLVLMKVANESDQIQTDEEYEDLEEAQKNNGIQTELTKKVDGDVLSGDIDEMKKYFSENLLPLLESSSPELSNNSIDLLANKFPLRHIIANMTGLGMFPKPREFQRIVLIQKGERDLADKFDREHICFNDADAEQYRNRVEPLDFDRGMINHDIIRMLHPMIQGRSYHAGPVIKRIMLIKQGATTYPIDDHREVLPAILAPIVALYFASKTGAMKELHPLVKEVMENKKAVGAVLAGSLILAEASKRRNTMNKIGSFNKNVLLPYVGVPLATFLYGGHVITKANRGQKINAVDKAIVNHPVASSLIGAGIASKPGRDTIVSASKNIFNQIANLAKRASAEEDSYTNEDFDEAVKEYNAIINDVM